MSKPIDWPDIIRRLEACIITDSGEVEEIINAAGDWSACPCGQLKEPIVRWPYCHVPVDEELRDLGMRFYIHIIALSQQHDLTAENRARNETRARQCLYDIHHRAREIT